MVFWKKKEHDDGFGGFKVNHWYFIHGDMTSYIYINYLNPQIGYEEASVGYSIWNDNGCRNLAHTYGYFCTMLDVHNEIENIPPEIEAKFLLLS